MALPDPVRRCSLTRVDSTLRSRERGAGAGYRRGPLVRSG